MKRFCRIITVFFYISIIVTTISCHSKQDAISRLEDLYEELQQNGGEYTSDDWDAVIAEMNDIDEMLKHYKSEYSEEEIKEIGRLKGLCLAHFAKYKVYSIKDQLKNVMKEAEGLFEGFTKGLTDKKQ